MFESDSKPDEPPSSPNLDHVQVAVRQYPSILTVDEAAELLRINRKTLYNEIQAGNIPGARRLGRTIRLHLETVLQWLSEGQGRIPRSKKRRHL